MILFDYPKKLENIFDKLLEYGVKPIIIGGYIRDKILGIDSIDIDIEVYNINSFEILENILKNFGNVNNVGKSFGVCKLNYEEFKLDFTLPRSDNKVSIGHSGFEIKIDSSLDFISACSRRDFTINTIGYDVKSKTLLDPYQGINDLKNKILKVVKHNKFGEDPLRILRAMQFCARFKLKPDVHLLSICKNMCNKGVLEELPSERIFEEFNKLFLKSSKPSIGLNFLKSVNGLYFFDELSLNSDDWTSTLDALDKCNKDITVMLAVTCYKMQDSKIESFITKLTNQKSVIKEIKKFHHIAYFFNKKSNLIKYNIIKNIDTCKLYNFMKSIGTKENDQKLLKYLIPNVHGKDLIDAGFKPSKDFSQIIQMIYEVQCYFIFKRSVAL